MDTYMAGLMKIADGWTEILSLWCPPPTSSGQPVSATVVVTGAGRLHPTAFLDGSGNSIAETCVRMTPSTLPSGSTAVTVTVTVTPPVGTPSGMYVGAILDDHAGILVARVPVTV